MAAAKAAHHERRSASDLFVRALEIEGVKYIFGVPGEENLDFVQALKQSTVQLIVCRHEQAAAFMAATIGRLTGRPGVAIATLGPGPCARPAFVHARTGAALTWRTSPHGLDHAQAPPTL